MGAKTAVRRRVIGGGRWGGARRGEPLQTQTQDRTFPLPRGLTERTVARQGAGQVRGLDSRDEGVEAVGHRHVHDGARVLGRGGPRHVRVAPAVPPAAVAPARARVGRPREVVARPRGRVVLVVAAARHYLDRRGAQKERGEEGGEGRHGFGSVGAFRRRSCQRL